ncbi:cytochrome P450 [Ophiobolus disseminans]|uniref:Cytochrome P450 n=1 Tax=Ophiobolus disseminans TaxID=1469910 RepID=A0A6A7A3B2_9PLEO|nr:cytochrome P450 [Ophiobolus disseminans]
MGKLVVVEVHFLTSIKPESPTTVSILGSSYDPCSWSKCESHLLTIVVFGHVKGMLMNASDVFTRGRQYFGNSREPFTLTIMGEELYIITSPEDVLAVYRETTALEFDPIVQEILGDFGVRKETSNKMFDRSYGDKHWMDLSHTNFKLQMHPGEKLEVLQSTFLGNIDHALKWENMSGPMIQSTSEDNNELSISLWEWCGHVLVDSATRAFFGGAIYRISPDLLKDFFVFDEQSWKLPYKYPYWAARDMGDASWIVKELERGMEDLGIEEEGQKSPLMFLLYRLVNTNAYRLCFWCLAHLLFDQKLLDSIKEETKGAIQPDGTLSMPFLLEHCHFLSSFYEEILRISNDPIGTRIVKQPVTIGNRTLLPGHRVLMPYKQMHFDPVVFGSNAADFDSRRFLDNKNLVRSTSYRPFGGAATHCPGRFLARREVYMFVVLVIHRFDVELDTKGGEAKFPRLDETVPSGGVLTPIEGDGVVIKLIRSKI